MSLCQDVSMSMENQASQLHNVRAYENHCKTWQILNVNKYV